MPLSPDQANGHPAGHGALRAAHRCRAHVSSHVLRIDGNCREEAWAAVGHGHQVTAIPLALGPPGTRAVSTWTVRCLAGCFPAVSGVIDPKTRRRVTLNIKQPESCEANQSPKGDSASARTPHRHGRRTHSLLRSHAASSVPSRPRCARLAPPSGWARSSSSRPRAGPVRPGRAKR